LGSSVRCSSSCCSCGPSGSVDGARTGELGRGVSAGVSLSTFVLERSRLLGGKESSCPGPSFRTLSWLRVRSCMWSCAGTSSLASSFAGVAHEAPDDEGIVPGSSPRELAAMASYTKEASSATRVDFVQYRYWSFPSYRVGRRVGVASVLRGDKAANEGAATCPQHVRTGALPESLLGTEA
jgi:hypothetical protein